MSTADPLLDLLAGVRRIRDGQWYACCPAHEDRHPSLSITEKPDGVVLLRCFSGCSAPEIVGAVGLSLSDLFPPRPETHQPPSGRRQDRRRDRRRFSADQLLHVLDYESRIVHIVACDAVDRGTVSEADLARLAVARRRISAIMEEMPD